MIDPKDSTLLAATPLLDYLHPALQELVQSREWDRLETYERIGAIYDFVRDEIPFGYNTEDELPASAVLADGYGQCNTKATLLMALFRATGIACRLHGFTIDKKLQKGAVTGLWYQLAPRNIVHSWVEIQHNGRWLDLEGFILDTDYLRSLQRLNPQAQSFCGFGVATPDLQSPQVKWSGSDTYIQREGINQDFGIFPDPDSFYRCHGSNLTGLKRWIFSHAVRHQMNRNVVCIRRFAEKK